MLNTILNHLAGGDWIAAAALACALLPAWLFPRLGGAAFSRIERLVTQLARKKTLAIVVMAMFPIVVRLSLLPLIPVPVPHIHDEFSYLLAADTFASMRLANPPHPMWIFFDTIHVNQHPTYMSKYPPAQGAVLALGQALGSPWIGVLLSVGIMSGAVLWMLQGWLPPPWALVGGLLVVLRVAIFSYWMNSYWGGAVPAIGGALVIGALPRIIRPLGHPLGRPFADSAGQSPGRSLRIRYGIIMGIGVAVLMNSRPFEGLSLCVPAGIFLAAWLFSKGSPAVSTTLPRLVLPVLAIVMLSFAFMAYYNWRGTGHILTMPYMLNEQAYWSTPTLLWQKLRPPIHFSNPQFEAFYNGWARELWLQTSSGSVKAFVAHAASVAAKFAYFYLWPELCVLIVVTGRVLSDRRVRFLVIEAAFCFATFLCVAWFQPHYAAAMMATAFGLITQALRHLRRWEFKGKLVGVGLTRVVMAFAVVLAPFHPYGVTLKRSAPSGIECRAAIARELDSTPGNHLVIVRYTPRHDPLSEWVYNRADIDRAKVTWAREIPGIELRPLLDYYKGRQVWLVDADDASPHLMPYDGK